MYEINYKTIYVINCKTVTDRPEEVNEFLDWRDFFFFFIVQTDVCNGLETLKAPIARATKNCKVNDTFKDYYVG